jgi:hypothetical protein
MAVVAMAPHSNGFQSDMIMPDSLAEKKMAIGDEGVFKMDIGLTNQELDMDGSPLVELLESSRSPTRAQIREAVAKETKQGMSMSSILRTPTSSGWPLLIFAAQRGMSNAVLALLELGADVESKEPASGWTALMYAVAAGNQAMVRDLLAHSASPNEFAKPSDFNPLAVAIMHNQESIMGMLLDAGASPALIKKRHPSLFETYAVALQQYRAKREAEESRRTQTPYAVYVKNAAEYC